MTKISHHFLLFFLYFLSQSISGQNATTPGSIETYQTINSIGIEWPITGDDNNNCICSVNYRLSGETNWKKALPLYRIDFNGANIMAGSILFLEPSTTYEVQLTLSDADGGNSITTLSITTRNLPLMPTGGNTYHVTTGNGGGTGTASDPFKGIPAAQAVAQPGDIFLLATGEYSSNEDNGKIQFNVSGTADNYIVWKAEEGAIPILTGARINCDFIWLFGITIQNQEYGVLVDSSLPEGIAITNSHFKNNHYGIYINHGGSNWYIADNIIEGDITDYTSGVFDGEGVELYYSDGCIVAHNKIFNVADGVSYPGKNCDIFGNEIYNVSDDGIEFDYGYANNRAWQNRITNANNNGISFQPMNGSPLYIIRNQVYVHNEDALKLREAVDRVLLAHNTLVCWEGLVASETNRMVSFQSNNNLYISVSDRYVWEDNSGSTSTNWMTNLNYDGFDWNNNTYALKWQNVRYTTLEEFQNSTGLESNGIRVRKSEIFENYDFPAIPSPAPLQYLSLKEGCNAINAGIALDNINDGFLGSAPDLGAFEFGASIPSYGPRSEVNTSVKISPKENSQFHLYQNYPNPFNHSTTIDFQINEKSHVKLRIFDLAGRELVSLLDEEKSIGSYSIDFNARQYGMHNGIYFLKLETEKTSKSIKIEIVK